MKKLLLFGALIFSSNLISQTFGGGVVDIDGNNYPTVIIGNQEWMAENLRTTRYANGDTIPLVNDNSTWTNSTSGAYCWFNYDSQYDTIYGKLYNWFTGVDPRNLCPTGWRVPSDQDWADMILTLDPTANSGALGIESQTAGGLLKETGYVHWNSPNTGATNSTGFTGIPGGARGSWNFNDTNAVIGRTAIYWATDEGQNWEGRSRGMRYNEETFKRGLNVKQSGFSIRCMKDYSGSGVGLIELIDEPKNLVKIVDLMGRETVFKPNTVLIYVYDDGSTERVMKLEE